MKLRRFALSALPVLTVLAACGGEEPPPAAPLPPPPPPTVSTPPAPPPAPADPQKLDKLTRTEFNRIAPELGVPLFWVSDND